MTSVLVLGASGFLGAHVRRECAAYPGVTQVIPFGRHQLDLAVATAEEIAAVLDRTGCEVVVNCTGRLDGSPAELAQANLEPTVKLVQALSTLPRTVRLLRLGSAGEYGPVGVDRSVREDDPTWPVTLYGATHLAATHLLRAASEQGLVEGTTLRVFNPIGPRGPSLPWQVAQRLAEALATGATAITTGPLTCSRDFVDARDVGRAVAAAVTTTDLPPVINLGSGTATCIREVVALLADLAGFTGSVLQTQGASRRSAGVSWTQADISLATSRLGWRPRYSLADSLRELWAVAVQGMGTESPPSGTATSPRPTATSPRPTAAPPRPTAAPPRPTAAPPRPTAASDHHTPPRPPRRPTLVGKDAS